MKKEKFIPCTPKQLPKKLQLKAAQQAIEIHPPNGVARRDGLPAARIAVLVSKYWGPAPRQLSVSFMESTPADLKARILSHMNAWSARCNKSFALTTGTGEVRISRTSDGYWSYLGVDVLQIPTDQQTMNLEAFTMQTPESEYRRVVRHETGHTCGFPHEHMRREFVARLNAQACYAYFARYGWDKQTVDEQVLTPLEDASIMAPGLEPTPADQASIMCYQLPGSVTKDGQPILGGVDINDTDYGFAAKIYPLAVAPPPPAWTAAITLNFPQGLPPGLIAGKTYQFKE